MHLEAFLRRSSENSYYYAKIGVMDGLITVITFSMGGTKPTLVCVELTQRQSFYHTCSRSYFVMKIDIPLMPDHFPPPPPPHNYMTICNNGKWSNYMHNVWAACTVLRRG